MSGRSPVRVLNDPKRWNRVGIICARISLACGAVGALLYVLLSVTASHAHTATTSRPIPVQLPTTPSPAAATQPSRPAAPDLVLPQPTGYSNGVPTGYPKTQAGAVAAAYGYSRIATGLDVQATLAAIQSISDPASGWFRPHRAAMADSLVAQRKELGLPAEGPAGMALLNVAPASYRVEHTAPDAVTVLTLNLLSAESTEGTMTSGSLVLRWALHWNGSSWLVTAPYSSSGDDRLAVTPLTSQAENAGWKVATGG
jgi:hypothetical protein